MITLINIFFICSLFLYLKKNKFYFSTVLYLLIIAFNYIPYIVLKYILFDYLNQIKGEEIIEYSVFLLSIGYYFSTKINNRLKDKIKIRESKNSIIILIINIIISVIMILNNLDAAIQLINSGYLSLYNNNKTLFMISNISLIPLYLISLFIDLRAKNENIKKLKILFLVLLILSYLISGSRSTAIYLFLVFLTYYLTNKKLNIKKTITHIFIGLLILSIIGLLREGADVIENRAGILLRPIYELNQTVEVFLNVINVINIDQNRYFYAMIYILPNFIGSYLGINHPELLSKIYVEIIDPMWAEKGGGYGFSILAEMYLIGGYLSNLVLSGLLGWIAISIDLAFKSNNNLSIALAALMAFYLLLLPRGEFIEIYRVLAIYLIGNMILYLKRKM